jgi:hypothetical protein
MGSSLGKLVDGTFQFHLAARPQPADLAVKLLPLILGQASRDERVFALGWILADTMIPYRRIPAGGVTMSDAEYDATLKRLRDKVQLMDTILRYPNLQGTETASLLLGVITDGTTAEEQAVLLARHMRHLQHQSVAALLKEL